MVLKTIYSSQDEIPENYRDLFTERNGQWELTGVEGVKTQGDVDRLQTALTKERNDHKDTKAALEKFNGLDPDEVHTQLDKIPALEAAAQGKSQELDEAQKRQITAPLERQITALTTERDQAKTEAESLRNERRTDKIRAALTDAAVKGKVIDTALEDVILYGERVFDLTDDGSIIVKDGVGFTPGIDPSNWLQDMQAKRPHWWPPSQGGGAGGSSQGGGTGTANPWKKDQWNMTEQGKIYRENPERAEQLAKQAGTTIGGAMPA